MCIFFCCQTDDEDSDSSDAVIELHSTESDEHKLMNQVDEALSAYSNFQKLIDSLSSVIRQAIGCYDLKLYVTRIKNIILVTVFFCKYKTAD